MGGSGMENGRCNKNIPLFGCFNFNALNKK